MKQIHYVYKIVNLFNGHFYIGKHSSSNIDDAYMGSGEAIKAAIRKHGKYNFKKYVLGVYDSEAEAYAAERFFIGENFKNEFCYNQSGGGIGVGTGENHPLYGVKNKGTCKRVYRFDPKSFVLIDSFDSIGDALEHLGHDRRNRSKADCISRCCNGKAQTACGFIWSYKPIPDISYPLVCQVWKGELVAVYRTGRDAAEAVGGNAASISLCLRNKKSYKTHMGYYWIWNQSKVE